MIDTSDLEASISLAFEGVSCPLRIKSVVLIRYMHGRCCPNQATGVLPGRTAGTIHNKGVSMDVTHFKLTSKILFQPVDAGVLSPTALALGSQLKQVRCGFQCWFWEALGSSVQVLEVLGGSGGSV